MRTPSLNSAVWFALIIGFAIIATLIFGHFCWFKRNEHVALWLEGVALVFIFGLDYLNRLDQAEEQKSQHKETLRQLDLLSQQAQAASDAATAAKRSAELTAALHRPYVGIDSVAAGSDQRYFNASFSLKNFGTLSAFNVGFSVEYIVDDRSRSRHDEPTEVQIFPSDGFRVEHQFDAEADGQAIRAGEKKLRLHASVPYRTEDGRQFVYTAQLSFEKGRFVMEKSSTAAK